MKFLTPEELQKKGNAILITNACNLSCGGCNQMCPNLKVKDKWHIPFGQLINNLDTMVQFRDDIVLTGGEPTIHPEWERIKELLHDQYPFINFWVATNHAWRVGCDTPEPEGNIHYHCDNDMRNTGHYLPTLAAPIDIYQVPDRDFYLYMAHKYCWMLQEDCSAMLYDNKAYFCQLAGGFERVVKTHHGWNFDINADPFQRSQEDILRQARSSCYRCAFCLDPETKDILTKRQKIDGQSLVTSTNAQFFKRKVAHIAEAELLQLLPDALSIGQSHKTRMKAEWR